MSARYAKRLLSATFSLAYGKTFEEGGNQLTVSGLRMSASVQKAGGLSMGETHLRVYGMTASVMNQLSTISKVPYAVPPNVLTISAGDSLSGMGIVFIGTISAAWADYQSQPEVGFEVLAHAGHYDAVNPVPPRSYEGSVDVETIMSSLAEQMGLSFENNGVQVRLTNAYFPGTAKMQMDACAKAAGINATIDNGTLAIWPRGGSRGGAVPLISPDTGMVGYPTYTATGLVVTTLFNPSITFGAQVQVQSSLPNACGTWRVVTLTHELQSLTPGGVWFTRIEGAPPGYAVVK